MTRFVATLLLVIVAGGTRSAAAQAPKAAERKPVPTKPTPPEKVKALKPLPRSIVGYQLTWWELSPQPKEFVEGEVIETEQAEIVALADGIVTLRNIEGKYLDVAIAELSASTQHTLARVERLLQGKPAADESRLLGSWRLVEQTRNGSDVKFKLGHKLIITGTGLHFPGSISAQPWRIDVKPAPKHLDFGAFLPETALRGIYELRGDELRLCVNDDSSSTRPTAFDRLQDHQTYCLFRRLPNLNELPPPNPQDLDPEVTATIREFIGHLEAGRTKEAMHRMFPPAHLAKFSQEEQEESLKYLDETKDHALLALKAMLRIAPKLNADRTRADFDFSHVHLDDFEDNGAQAALEKIAGRWYLADKEEP